MRATIAWWDLAGTGHSIASMRRYLADEAIDHFRGVEGLRLKFWIADPRTERWGAVLLWESAEAAARPLPPRAAELIGRSPAQHTVFEVEAVLEGLHTMPGLPAGLLTPPAPAGGG
ncbi:MULTISPECIES: hypothetical protein [unclassified Streptomyces]|uniref:hypothetical protein n=1 Tax=unclassified Streptomyces TaxID=2593676 RepID=UPI000DAC3B7F|nr:MULTISPECIES: hypothetical protein [unclassified Streptomyces]PZT74833.1 hypothetical protein DNK55_22550 [Streptomyces sp. AC1-42T]PZT82182.1 hypothetical protein DNK56_08895 [Streptomyces sp. AC1-42W]